MIMALGRSSGGVVAATKGFAVWFGAELEKESRFVPIRLLPAGEDIRSVYVRHYQGAIKFDACGDAVIE